MSQFEISFVWRSLKPATQPANEAYPLGQAMDLTNGALPACLAKLKWPAEGVGTWMVTCLRCGFTAAITAAGRADDPTQVLVPCKAKENA